MNGGAVAYLTNSQYGRNGNEISINNSGSYITGSSAGRPGDENTEGDIINAYNTEAGMLASTTGNIYGVYDMSGGSWERTAVWDTKSSSLSNGKAVDGEGKEKQHFKTNETSDKYKTAYSNGTDTRYGETVETVCRTGDGIKETWVSSNRSWFNDYSFFVSSSRSFSDRGGGYSNGAVAGVLYAHGFDGDAYGGGSFRTVLAG